jgi:hypothetical protein
LPVPALPSLAYARFGFRAALQFSADAAAQASANGAAGALISCQHAWEMAGKCALAIEAPGFAFPPSRTSGPHWMRDHRVLSNLAGRRSGWQARITKREICRSPLFVCRDFARRIKKERLECLFNRM